MYTTGFFPVIVSIQQSCCYYYYLLLLLLLLKRVISFYTFCSESLLLVLRLRICFFLGFAENLSPKVKGGNKKNEK